MAQITSITPQKKDKMRCNIEVDGRFYCGMKLETVMQNHLKAGDCIDLDELSRMQLESEKLTALDKALTHISASMKTEREIRTFLQKKGYLQDVCDFVLERMKGYGYVNDGDYCRAYMESAAKRKGGRLIRQELLKKGVDAETVDEALLSLTDETESAKRCFEKYMRGKSTDRETLQKAYRHLLSKGYDFDTAKAALESLKDDED